MSDAKRLQRVRTPQTITAAAMTVALYCRVSTDEQAQQGFSIASQKQRLAAFCVAQGWPDYTLYVDDGYSGTTLERPALRRMLQDIALGRIQTVVVYRLDRLGRKQKDVLHLLEDVFETAGITFKSATEPFDTATPLGKAMLGILAVFAQLERDTIVERTTMGRRQRIQGGLWHGGRVPLGYRWQRDAQTLVIEPQEAAVIRAIYRRFLRGESLSRIATWAGTQTAARRFTHTSVRQLLTRPLYAGYLNHAGDLVRGQHPAIVDDATFARAQAALERRQHTRRPAGHYLLSGLVVCGVCGGPVIHIRRRGSASRDGQGGGSGTRGRVGSGEVRSYEYYGCKRQHTRPRGSGARCTLGYRRQAEVEAAVLLQVRQLSLSPAVIGLSQVDVSAEAAEMLSERRRVLRQLREQNQDTQARLQRWYEAFESGAVGVDEMRDRVHELEAARATLRIRLTAVEGDLATEPRAENEAGLDAADSDGPSSSDGQATARAASGPTPPRAETLVADAWSYLSEAEQQAIVNAAVKRVTLYPAQVDPRIEWNT